MFPEPMFPGTYVPRYLCSPVPMFLEPKFPGTYVPRTYVPRYLCSPIYGKYVDVVIGNGIPSELFDKQFRFVNGRAYIAETQTHTHTHTHTHARTHAHTHTSKNNHVTFLNLYIDLIWWATRKRSIPEGYMKVIEDICRTYRGSKTRVKTMCGRAENVKVGFLTPGICAKSASLHI